MVQTKIDRLSKTIPSLYNPLTNRFVKGLIEAWAQEDEVILTQIAETKDQLFVETADLQYLTALGQDRGVPRPLLIALADVYYRDLIVSMSYAPKQVRKTMYEVLDIFWGPTYSRANVTSDLSAPYNFLLPTGLTGTISYKKGSVTMQGSGTLFTSELTVGDYMRLNSDSNSAFVKVVKIIDNSNVVVFEPAIKDDSGSGVVFTSKDLSIIVNDGVLQTIMLNPKFFNDTSAITADEIASAINDEHIGATASTTRIFGNSNLFVNLRTDTPGIQGSIQVVGGSANALLNFNTSRSTVDDLIRSTVIYEINPREIVLAVPNLVAKLIRTLKGSYHTNAPITGTITAIDNILKTITLDLSESVSTDVLSSQYLAQGVYKFNVLSNTSGQLGVVITFSNGDDLTPLTLDASRFINSAYANSYVYDPESNFNITGKRTTISQNITSGSIVTVLNVDDAADIPDQSGFLCFDFGNGSQENLVPYISRPNNSTLILNSTYTFTKDHQIGDNINVVINQGYDPRNDGGDYAVYVTGTLEALQVVQSLISKLKAAGVILRWIIDYPTYRFPC